MRLNRDKFFTLYRAAFSKLTQKQVNGINAFLDNILSYNLKLRELAYLFATTYHETAMTFLPLEEYGKGKGRPYGKAVNGKRYYGRGYVQLTWDYNYAKATKTLRVQCPAMVAEFEEESGQTFDLVEFPAQAMHPKIACAILVLGSQQGWFTGKKLSDYINENKCDFINARRIINGTDQAKTIAGHAQKFKELLSQAFEEEPEPLPVVVETAQAVVPSGAPAPAVAKVSLFTKIGTAVTGITALGLNVGAIVETKLKEMSPAHIGYLCLTLIIVGLAIWWYRASSDNAHKERMKGGDNP